MLLYSGQEWWIRDSPQKQQPAGASLSILSAKGTYNCMKSVTPIRDRCLAFKGNRGGAVVDNGLLKRFFVMNSKLTMSTCKITTHQLYACISVSRSSDPRGLLYYRSHVIHNYRGRRSDQCSHLDSTEVAKSWSRKIASVATSRYRYNYSCLMARPCY